MLRRRLALLSATITFSSVVGVASPAEAHGGSALPQIARRVGPASTRAVIDHAGPRPVTCAARVRVVRPSDDVQAALDSAGPGASVCFTRGTYRLAAPLRPLDDQILTFERKAILSGARLVSGWRREGRHWVVGGQTQEFSSAEWLSAHKCNENPMACVYEDLYWDGKPLSHVQSLDVLSRGEVYFDKVSHRMYVATDPTGHTLEATVLTVGIESTSSAVTIRGATIEKMGWLGVKALGGGWAIEDSEIRFVHGTGLRLSGNNLVIRRNYLHHNGNTGMNVGPSSYVVVVANELAHNNYLHFGQKPVPHHEGAAKFHQTSNVSLRRNHSHHNDGDGWWFDWDNIDVRIENNVFESNSRYGLFYEVSFDALIRNNLFRRNGTDVEWLGSGVRVSTSKNVEIIKNRFVRNGYSSLYVNWESRGAGSNGAFQTTGLHVRRNVFLMTNGWVGSTWGLTDVGDEASGNRFQGNTYIVSDPTRQWWSWLPGGFRDWAAWRAAGFDRSGSLIRG